jgi:gliding motility-associated-like protein
MPATYLNSSTISSPIVSALSDITFDISASTADAPCKASATTTIKIQKRLFIPSAFTPNGDGRNDTWRNFNLEGHPDCTVEVNNRWGNRVFYSKCYSTSWNGTMNNQPLPTGTYLYNIRARSRKNNIIETGIVTIIR